MAVELAPELLEILACPNCHSSLAVDHDRDELICTAPDCGLAYPVRVGIPVLLVDEARSPQRPGAAPDTAGVQRPAEDQGSTDAGDRAGEQVSADGRGRVDGQGSGE